MARQFQMRVSDKVRNALAGFASKVAVAEDFARRKNDPRNDTNEHESN
jgi:hypothetical protein